MALNRNKNKKINTQYLQDVAEQFRKNNSNSSMVDIITFIEAQWGLNQRLYPVQKFVLKSFYGMELDGNDKTISLADDTNSKIIGRFTEQEFMKYLIETGRTNLKEYVPGKKRRELILNIGRRGTKSSMTSFISSYELYRLCKMVNPQRYFGLPNGSEIGICTTAPSKDAAKTLFGTIRNYCLSCNYLKDRIVNKSEEFFTLATDYDRENGLDPSIRLICGGAASDNIRGHSNIVVIMDEAAYFKDTGENSGEDLYRALAPSILSFIHEDDNGNQNGEGKVVLISSPMGKSGLFYKQYMDSFSMSENILMFNMYTSMINPRTDSSTLKDEKKRNPAMFNCEYGARFSDTISSWVDEQSLRKVVDDSLPVNPRHGKRGIEYYMGIDYAGKTDGAAISIVHRENGKIVLDYSDVFYGSQSDVWWDGNKSYESADKKFSNYELIPLEGFADEIKRLSEDFPIKYGWFDQFNGYGLMEMLKDRNLYQFEARSLNVGLNMQMYQIVKELINSELIRIPDHPILLPEMLSLEESKNGARIVVEAPNRTGCHDDITDSFVEACYACHTFTSKKNDGMQKSIGVCTPSPTNHGYYSYHIKKMREHGYSAAEISRTKHFR